MSPQIHCYVSFPLYPSDLMHSTLSCSVIPEKFHSLKAEHLPSEEANLDTKIPVKLLLYPSTPVSTRPSMTMSFIRIFNFGLCSFIEVCQNTHFMVSPEIFVLSSIVVLLSRAVWFLTIGSMFFNWSEKNFLYNGRKWLNQIWHRFKNFVLVTKGSLVDLHSLVQYLLFQKERTFCFGLCLE